MALVSSLQLNAKARQSVHRPTQCYYSIVDGVDGQRYLQLDTIGSTNREIPEKVSQSIQFDRQAAIQLIQILRQAFPNLAEIEEATESKGKDSADDEEGEEGRTLLRLHRMKERVPRLVRRKKQTVLEASGQLLCEVCDFNFSKVYGSIGVGFAECHHRMPLASFDGKVTTKLADLAIVCSNCHRMLHRRPFHTVERLRSIVAERRSAGEES